MDYKKHIGDGKTPNRYWVFHYDEKFMLNKDREMTLIEDKTQPTSNHNDGFLGEFKTYKEALSCVDNKAYLPHVVIEDRLSGEVFTSYCLVCPCCKKEDYETYEDIGFTRKKLTELGIEFK